MADTITVTREAMSKEMVTIRNRIAMYEDMKHVDVKHRVGRLTTYEIEGIVKVEKMMLAYLLVAIAGFPAGLEGVDVKV